MTSVRGSAGRLLGAAVLVLVSGCTVAQDDEMVPPTRTVTASPSPATPEIPSTVPVGRGRVEVTDAVWAEGRSLHVGTREVDLAPLSIDSLVVVPGGVYFLDGGRLWFTDLVRARDTGLTGVTRLWTTRTGDAIGVEVGGAAPTVAGFDAGTGSSLPPSRVVPATLADRLGQAVQVVLRPERSDVTAPPPDQAPPGRVGPGGFGIVGGAGEPLVAFDSGTRQRIPLTGVRGNGFELVRWTTGNSFYGLARQDGRATEVLSCRLRVRACTSLGTLSPGAAPVFESGT